MSTDNNTEPESPVDAYEREKSASKPKGMSDPSLPYFADHAAGRQPEAKTFERASFTTRSGGVDIRESPSEHYLRHIRNGVTFLAVLAGVGVAWGVIDATVIAVKLAHEAAVLGAF